MTTMSTMAGTDGRSAAPLGVALIGCGSIANPHLAGWRRLVDAGQARLEVACDSDPERARAAAERYGAAAWATDFEQVVRRPEVDAIDVCLPHHLHAEAIVAAARAGKAVLTEKPLCTSLADAALVAAALRETGVPFMAAHNQLFQPSLVEARRLLQAGILGRPFLIRSIEAFQNRSFGGGRVPLHLRQGESPWAWRTDPARMGGGEVLDTGWHGSYRLLALADDRPVEVSALMERFFVADLPSEDTGVLLVRFASGAIGEMTTSWAFATIDGLHFEVAAERGTVAGGDTRLVHQLHGWPAPAVREVAPVHTFTEEVRHFLDVVQEGEANLAPFAQAARVLQLTKAAYRAAAEHRAMALPEDPLEPPVPAAATAEIVTGVA
jgi:predicted dehydrogenase